MARVLREPAFAAVEALVRSRALAALRVSQAFGHDALGYFTERMSAEGTREALAQATGRAKMKTARPVSP